MNLEKAIEKLSDSANRGMTTFDEDYKTAQKLGIEALKVQYRIKCQLSPKFYHPLPGETED